MKGRDFLRDKLVFIALHLFIAGFGALLLWAENTNLLVIPAIFLLISFLSLLSEYLTKNNYYRITAEISEQLDKKYLLSEIISRPEFCEGKILYDLLKQTGKSMNDEIATYSAASLEYREYIEIWVHEIKTPIAGAKLICENIGAKEALAELEKIERFVEQALFYSRSGNVEKDYLIRRTDLAELVKGALRSHAAYLIAHKIGVQTEDLAHTVFTDAKWVTFILRQLMDNSVKYGCKKLEIFGVENESSVSLFLRDDGDGIPKQDVDRVFEKGFTGENGRRYGRSTGLGLYLCRKLCLRLGLRIGLTAEAGRGVTVEIVFPRSDAFDNL